MAHTHTKVLLVTANVGSIFEDPERMLKIWLSEFISTIQRLAPEFVAVHCQEVGGKNYEESMQHVNQFIKNLLASEEMQVFDKARVFLDEDFTAVDKFTALGNLYFVRDTVKNIQIYNFQECKFESMVGQEVLSGNIETVPIKEKAKFPQEFFPDCKWSRKGFIRTRWNLNNTIFDLINIHLFHDVSNIVAMETTPSLYSGNRERALRYTIERFRTDQYDSVPYFMFGDFNFRLDTHHLVQKLAADATAHETKSKKNEISKIEYTKRNNGKTILTVEKKGFDHHDRHDNLFFHRSHWLRQFDKELEPFRDKLHEYDVTFPPSYPFSEDLDDGTSYMKTRCPSWCDRILMTYNAKNLIQTDDHEDPPYKMIGHSICMGDHKPIYLNVKLRCETGNQAEVAEAPRDNLIRKRPPLRKVISINGEEVRDVRDLNIHDNIIFEHEHHLARKFLTSLRRRSEPVDRSRLLIKQRSFSNVARNVLRAESVLQAFQHYAHRSDTESESEDEESKDKAKAVETESGVANNADESSKADKSSNADTGIDPSQVTISSDNVIKQATINNNNNNSQLALRQEVNNVTCMSNQPTPTSTTLTDLNAKATHASPDSIAKGDESCATSPRQPPEEKAPPKRQISAGRAGSTGLCASCCQLL